MDTLNTERTYKWKLSGSARQSEIGILCFDWLIHPGVSYSREIWIFSEREGSFKAFYRIHKYNINISFIFAVFLFLPYIILPKWLRWFDEKNAISPRLLCYATVILAFHHCTGSQQSASRGRALAFYRIAPCLTTVASSCQEKCVKISIWRPHSWLQKKRSTKIKNLIKNLGSLISNMKKYRFYYAGFYCLMLYVKLARWFY